MTLVRGRRSTASASRSPCADRGGGSFVAIITPGLARPYPHIRAVRSTLKAKHVAPAYRWPNQEELMAPRIIQRACRLCENGVVDVMVTDEYDSGGNVVATLEDKRICGNGCLGSRCDFCPPRRPVERRNRVSGVGGNRRLACWLVGYPKKWGVSRDGSPRGFSFGWS